MKTFLSFVAGAVLVLGSFLFGAHSVNQSVPTPGASAGPDINSEYYSVNGQVVFKYHDAFVVAAAASTTCSRVSPNATTSLSFFSANISSTSPAALAYELGTAAIGGSDAWATTTLIGTKYAVPAANGMSITGSTTPSSTGSVILGPRTRVNFKGGSPTVAPKGTCNFTFTVL